MTAVGMDAGAAAAVSARAAASTRPRAWSWGLFPQLSLTAAAGVAIVALGNAAARIGEAWAEPAFYGGLLLLVLPIALRLLGSAAEGTERVSLVALLAVGLFLCKVVHDPIWFGAYDEFLHWRTAEDIMVTGEIFSPNTLLGVSPYYPGLELITTAVAQMTGLPIFDAGLIVLGAARIVFLMSLFFFFAMVSGSTRVAGIACLVYMTNPKFLYFNAQFSYETLGLPLAALVLYVLARRGHSGPARWFGLTVIALVTIPAVVTTHHVTSLMLGGFLVLWAIVGFVLRKHEAARPGRMAFLTVFLIGGWTFLVASATIGYLAPALSSTFGELFQLIAGEMDARELFVSRVGEVAPLWERAVGTGSAVLVVALLPFGLFVVWRKFRSNTAVMTLALAGAAFPATLVARLTQVGADVTSRTPEFIYVGVGMVVALALVHLSFSGRWRIPQLAGAGVLVAVLAVGGVIVGLPSWARLPGPYLVSADGRSVEEQGIAAAQWTKNVLGPGRPFVADRVNRMLMATYGHQHMITTYETRLPLRRLYLTREIGASERRIVAEGGIRYVVVDRRLATGPPIVGHYFDHGERPLIGAPNRPLPAEILAKWDAAPRVSRIFDSGDIQIYDVSALVSTG